MMHGRWRAPHTPECRARMEKEMSKDPETADRVRRAKERTGEDETDAGHKWVRVGSNGLGDGLGWDRRVGRHPRAFCILALAGCAFSLVWLDYSCSNVITILPLYSAPVAIP